MTLQRVSFTVPDGELEGILHLPDARAVGGAAVLHGYGGDPEQPHIVATCEALAAPAWPPCGSRTATTSRRV